MMILKNIKEYTQKRKAELKEQVSAMAAAPRLAIIQVGTVEASTRYVRNKIKDCEEVGIEAHWYGYEEFYTTEELIAEIRDLVPFYDGLIVQLPLPKHIDATKVLAAIPVEKDVDGFQYGSPFNPATPQGIMNYLKYCNFDLCGANVVVIGRSDIVGKPMARMLTDANATVTLCHSKTKHLYSHVFNADLVVCAVGKAKFLNCYPIFVPVIDVGINFDENGKMCGDCYNTENKDVTPVPGGVGLLTRCALLENVIKAKELQNDIK